MITEFLSQHHLLGLAIGLSTFLIIGMFHPIVIKNEYHFGVLCRWWFLLAGVGMCCAAYFVADIYLSVICGVVGFSCFWSILELYEQRERVRKGWFPKKPRS